MKHTVNIIFTLLILLVLSSCQEKKNRDAEIKAISLLQDSLKTADIRVDTLNLKDLNDKVRTIKMDLKELEKGYRGTMATKDAFNMDKYKNISHIYKSFKLIDIKDEIEETQVQLTNLKDLITMGATKDKDGNVIDEPYIDNAYNLETKYASELLKSIDKIDEKRPRFYKLYNEMKPYVDSLKMEMPVEE